MTGHGAIEVAKTVLEVADVAWTAVECCHHRHHRENHHDEENKSTDSVEDNGIVSKERELEALRSENRRLRSLLQQNLKLLQNLSESPELSQDCPPDLHDRVVSMVNSKEFLARFGQALVEENHNWFPFKEASGDDVQSAEILINVDQKEPSWWVWITDDMVPRHLEEQSGIDNENYVVVTEEHVVESVASFMAKCILSNPKAKNLRPEELQKALSEELGGMSKLGRMVHVWHAGKMFYTLATWGLALAGLYQTRAVLKIGAKGVHATSKAVLRAL